MSQSAAVPVDHTTSIHQTAWWSRLFAPVDMAPVAWFRVAFGILMLWEVLRYAVYGWIAPYYIEPTYHFSYPGFAWVQPWGGDGMYVHFLVLAILAICIMLGLAYRVSAVLFFLGFTYVFLLDQTRYLNHFYLISLVSFLMIFLPANRSLALDMWIPDKPPQTAVPAWALWLLRFQVGVAYFYGGIAKINPDWLAGEPIRMWLADRTDFPVIGQFFTEEWMVGVFAYGGLLFDLLVVPLLLWKRTRALALLLMLGFHLMNAQMFSIGIFPWFMIAATVTLFPLDWFKRVPLWRLGGMVEGSAGMPVVTPQRQRLVVLLVSVFVVWQVLFPLRHWLYPGYVSWTEEGHNFAWHMKLRTKAGDLQMYILDHNTQLLQTVDLRDYLTTRQISKMATRPHLILQFSHYLADQLRAEGQADFGIYVRSWAALNARDWQMLIDPTVDLAAQPRDFWHKPWVIPLEQPVHPPA